MERVTTDACSIDAELLSMQPTDTIRARQTRSRTRASIAPARSKELAGDDLVNAYLRRPSATNISEPPSQAPTPSANASYDAPSPGPAPASPSRELRRSARHQAMLA